MIAEKVVNDPANWAAKSMLLVCILVMFAAANLQAMAENYILRGHLDCTALLADGAIDSGLTAGHDFSVTYDKTFTRYIFQWDASTDAKYLNNGPAVMFMSSDTTNIYLLRYGTTNGVIIQATTNCLEIIPGSFPFTGYYVMDLQTFLWPCLGSKQYLGTRKSAEFPIPWRIPRSTPSAWGFALEDLACLEGSGLPKSYNVVRRVSLDLDPALESRRPEVNSPQTSNDQATFDLMLRRHRADYPEGYLQASYSVDSTSTIDSYVVPASFKLIIFNPYYTSQGRMRIVGKMSPPVRTEEESPLIPRLSDLIVRDERFRNFTNGNRIYNMIYPVEIDQQLPDFAGPLLQASYAYRLGHQSVTQASLLKRVGIIGAFVISCAVFAGWIYRRRSRIPRQAN